MLLTNTLTIGPICKSQRKWNVVNINPVIVFFMFQFICNLQIGSISQAYIKLGWKGLLMTNTLAIGPICKLQRKWNVNTWLISDKHTSLLGPFISYEENEVLWIWTQAHRQLCLLEEQKFGRPYPIIYLWTCYNIIFVMKLL